MGKKLLLRKVHGERNQILLKKETNDLKRERAQQQKVIIDLQKKLGLQSQQSQKDEPNSDDSIEVLMFLFLIVCLIVQLID